jgi:hypothetical protein
VVIVIMAEGIIFFSVVVQGHRGQALDGRVKKLTRRDTMGTLIFGAGTLLGLCLGILIISLLSSQRVSKF